MAGSDSPGCELDEAAFRGYVDAFNRNDFDSLAPYYAADIEFDGRAARLRGRDELLGFYRNVKSRVRETIAIQDVVVGRQALVADLITELYPLEDWPDFPTGALHKGETRRSQNFIWYDLAAGRFKRIRAAHYRRGASLPLEEPREPGAGVARTRDGSERNQSTKMTVEEFSAYIDAFNRDDYGQFAAYYDPKVVLVIGGQQALRGPQAICDFYRRVKAQTRRTIQLRSFVSAPDRVAAELESEFLALQDVPDFTAGPLQKGDRIHLNTVALYELCEGRFSRIRSATLRKLHRA